jgi:uncharacterized protein YjbI with pentapeptide repeats
MVRRVLQLTGTALVIAVAAVTPLLVTASTTPASADTVIGGCTIVSNPTPTNFTDCPNSELAGASLTGLNLSYANFSGSTFAFCGSAPPPNCDATDFHDANLTGADLTGIRVAAFVFFTSDQTGSFPETGSAAADFSGANLSGVNLTNTSIAGANLTDANLTGATLTGAAMTEQVPPGVTVNAIFPGANFTNTVLVPSNQTVTQTSPAGATATWSTPPGIPGATPGSCTPASGSTFPPGPTTVTCQVLDNNGDTATGTFQVHVVPVTQVVLPTGGATLAGIQYLDAQASDGPGVTKVQFTLTGGTLNHAVIATTAPTQVGWLAKWDTTTVPNGTYTLQSVATDAANNVSQSAPVTITVSNPPPTTFVAIPSNGSTQSGNQYLDAGASAGVTQVQYELNGGPDSYVDKVISGSTPTYVGWIGAWSTTSVPNGTYVLQSVASYAGGVSGKSPGIFVTVSN